MTVIKNGCICGGDYYTTTEQCDDVDCRSERKKTTMKNKDNEANGYNCVKCETGETNQHGSECSKNRKYTDEEINYIMDYMFKDENLCIIREALENQYN